MANKLELVWIGKETPIQPEPRILLEDKAKSYGDIDSENMLIHGDNLLALKALEQEYAGRVKCIYIDPPYNINAANLHYEDDIPVSDWLNLMKARVETLHRLLSKDGIIFISINYENMFHLKLLLDDIFGSNNFCNIVTVKTATTASYRSINDCPVNISEHIIIYAKNKNYAQFIPQYVEVDYSEDYSNYIENFDKPQVQWKMRKIDDIIYKQEGVSDWKEYKARFGDFWKEIRYKAKSIFALHNKESVCSLNTLQKPARAVAEMIEKSKLGKNTFFVFERPLKDSIIIYNGRTLAFYSSKVRYIDDSYKPSDILTNIWTDISFLSLGLEGGVDFANSKKPEKLIERIIKLSTNPGDLVLDSFLGSGTTAAVAHKMGRRWIGIEMGDHAYTHCKVRLDKVIDGTDAGGITKTVGWQGGGGYRFYELAPTLIKTDKLGIAIINPEYNAEMLAAAVAKHEGFTYAPNEAVFWKQASFENSYLFTTTRHITAEYLSQISSELLEGEFLVIAAKSFDDGINKMYKNIRVKKIPPMLLGRCEYGKDNYNLNIISVPEIESDDE
ncbi:MAG: site-specific DNA-methyltransferase [Dehalococcoidia bacterium]|nr:site-specific DNA-methyltransferase [Dehalococcoidia bacterium]